MLYYSAWVIGTWAVDKDSPWGKGLTRGSVYYGTAATCSAQGFILQFSGLASLLSNASLAIVFLWMIQSKSIGWREDVRQTYKLHAWVNKSTIFVWIVSLIVATVPLALDMYHGTGPVCWIAAEPYGCTETWSLPPDVEETNCTSGDNATLYGAVFQAVPVTLVVLVDAIIMCRIYSIVRRSEYYTTTTAITSNNATSNGNTLHESNLKTKKYDNKEGHQQRYTTTNNNGDDDELDIVTTNDFYNNFSYAATTTVVSNTSRIEEDIVMPSPSSSRSLGEAAVEDAGKDSWGATAIGHDDDTTVDDVNNDDMLGNDVYGNAPSYHSSSSSSSDDENDVFFMTSSTPSIMSNSKTKNVKSVGEESNCSYYGNAPPYHSSTTASSSLANVGLSVRSMTSSSRTAQSHINGTLDQISSNTIQQQDVGNHCTSESRLPNQNEGNHIHRLNYARNNNTSIKQRAPSSSQQQQQQQRSALFAQQSLLYIGGFILTFGLQTVSTLYFIVARTWNPPLDRCGYVFMASQGLWNFIVFSRRRRMKTYLGEHMKNLFWWSCCTSRTTRRATTTAASNAFGTTSGWRVAFQRVREWIVESFPFTRRRADIANPGIVEHEDGQEMGSPGDDRRCDRSIVLNGEVVTEIPRPLHQQRIVARSSLPILVENAEIVSFSGRTSLSSSDLHEMIRLWLAARVSKRGERIERTGSANEDTGSVCDTVDTIPYRPGAFRIGRDGKPIPSDDKESHLPSILGSMSSMATPHAQPVVSTYTMVTNKSSSCISRSDDNKLKDITKDDIIHILKEQFEEQSSRSQQQRTPHPTLSCTNTPGPAATGITDNGRIINTEAEILRILEEQYLVLLESSRDEIMGIESCNDV